MGTNFDSAKLNCLRLMLKPILRFALRNAIGIKQFHELCKIACVEVSAEEIAKTSPKINVSRISVITGISRPEVTRIYVENKTQLDETSTLVSRVTNRWEQTPRFCRVSGKPRVLEYLGGKDEFTELVRTVDTSINPGTVLFELERSGVIRKSGNSVKLVRNIPRFSRDPEQGYQVLAEDIESLIAAAEQNISRQQDEPYNLHIRTDYNNIFKSEVPRIRAWLLKEGSKFHKRARDLLSKCDKDIAVNSKGEAGVNVSVSAFSLIVEPEEKLQELG